ncbi:MAG: hypothetical protein IKP72_02690 [Clostridia bacterium]|nr:hypothetical protein [Clostridia bacterium]
MITGNVKELNQVKSVIANSMSIVHVFLGELMRKSTLEGQTETEKELMDNLETLYQNSEEVLLDIDQSIADLSAKKPQVIEDRPPWEGPDEE